LLEPGDAVMSDKGFNVVTLLRDGKVYLNMPAFLRGGQFNFEEVQENRIYVERAICQVKEYSSFQGMFPLYVWKLEPVMDCGSSVDKLQASSSEQVCTKAFSIF